MAPGGFAPASVTLFGIHGERFGLSTLQLALGVGVEARARREERPSRSSSELRHLEPRAERIEALAARGVDWPSEAISLHLVPDDAQTPPGLHGAAAVACVRHALHRTESGAATSRRRIAELAGVLAAGPSAPAIGTAETLASALEGVVHAHFGTTPFVQEIATPLPGVLLVACDAVAVPRAPTTSLAPLERLVPLLRAHDAALDLASLAFDRAWDLLLEIRAGAESEAASPLAERQLFALLRERDLLLAALRVLGESPLDGARLGELLDEQHVLLRETWEAASPSLEGLRAVAQAAGACGAWAVAPRTLAILAPGREVAVTAALAARSARVQRS